jgi:hypothetical protein
MPHPSHSSGFDHLNNNICFPNYLDTFNIHFLYTPDWLQRECYTQSTKPFPACSSESLVSTCQNIRWLNSNF